MRAKKPADVGAIVRQRRLDLRLSQAALAERANVTRQWLIRFEQGNGEVTLAKVFAVLRALELGTRIDVVSNGGDAARPGASTDAGGTVRFEIPRADPQLWARVPRGEEP